MIIPYPGVFWEGLKNAIDDNTLNEAAYWRNWGTFDYEITSFAWCELSRQCRNCIHYERAWGLLSQLHECRHPDSRGVDGYQFADLRRGFDYRCGREGRQWEEGPHYVLKVLAFITAWALVMWWIVQ